MEDKSVEVLNVEQEDVNPFEETMISEKKAIAKDWDMGEGTSSLKSEDINGVQPKKKRRIGLKIFLFLLFVVLMGVLSYFFYFANPQKIVSNSLGRTSNTLSKLLPSKINKLDVGKDSSLNNNITFKTTKVGKLNKEVTNLLNNLNNVKANVVIDKDTTNKKLLGKADIDYKDTSIKAKYLFSDGKGYYYVQDLSDKYIKNGNSNIDFDMNVEKEIKNMKDFGEIVSKSLLNSLKSKNFHRKFTSTKINGKNKTVMKLSLTLNNKELNNIYKNIVKDIQKDSKANKILKDLNINAKDIDTSLDIAFVDNKVEYNVYADILTLKEYKTEVVVDKYRFVYEEDKKNEIDIYEKENLIFKVKKNKDSITLYNAVDDKVGTISIEDDKLNTKIEVEADYDSFKVDVDLNSKATEISSGDKFFITTKIDIDVRNKNEVLYQGIINVDSTLIGDVDIKEDITDSIKYSDIKKEDRDKYLEKLMTSLQKLME